MNGLQGLAAKLAPILEFVGALVAAISAVVAKVNGGQPLNWVTVIAAVIAAFGHATSHTTAGGTKVP